MAELVQTKTYGEIRIGIDEENITDGDGTAQIMASLGLCDGWVPGRRTLALIFGGRSTEHEVSCMSCASVLENINRDKYNILRIGITRQGCWYLYGGTDSAIKEAAWADPDRRFTLCPCRIAMPDLIRGGGIEFTHGERALFVPVDVCFPVLHGKNGEDGTIQGLFEMCGMPYVGCGVTASAVAMDKALTKQICRTYAVDVADFLVVHEHELRSKVSQCTAAIEAKFKYPVFVKPANAGSSVGVSKANGTSELAIALGAAVLHDERVLVEEYVAGREIECSVLGNSCGGAASLTVSGCGEIVPNADFYDYQTKYCSDTAEYKVPAKLPKKIQQSVQRTALQVYCALGCDGMARCDFFVTPDGRVVFNEINTIPGFTAISMYPKLLAADGVPYPELIDRLAGLALERHGSRLS